MSLKARVLHVMVTLMTAFAPIANAIEVSNEWMPEINGTLRPRYEWSTETGEMRFLIRDARVGLNGHMTPFITYRAEVNLCQKGEVRCLDVWGRVALCRMFSIQMGQMRMPFTMGSYRPPHVYLFANRPITDKHLLGPRKVGVKGIFELAGTGLSVEAGIFNTSDILKHSVWQKHLGYAGKVRYIIAGDLTLLAGIQSLRPGDTRLNELSGAVSWDNGTFLLEGEYVYHHPTNKVRKESHAYNFMVNYGFPARIGYFNRLSFQGRWDGMTDTWDGISVEMTPARNRITVGSTLSYISGKLRTDLRLNYEQCFYHKGVVHAPDESNQLVAEIVVHF